MNIWIFNKAKQMCSMVDGYVQCAETMFENVQYIIKLKEKISMITMSMKKYITKSYNDFC